MFMIVEMTMFGKSIPQELFLREFLVGKGDV